MMTVMRQALKFISKTTALVGLAAISLSLSTPASAQPGPQIQAQLTLEDGRGVEVVTYADGLGHRFWLEGSDLPLMGRGVEVRGAFLADFDGDGLDDVIVDSAEGVEAIDVSTATPYFTYPLCNLGFEACRAERTERFGLARAAEILDMWQGMAFGPDAPLFPEAPFEGEAAMAFENNLNAVRGALFDAEIREARAELAAALSLAENGEAGSENEAAGAARTRLDAALAARSAFFENAVTNMFAD